VLLYVQKGRGFDSRYFQSPNDSVVDTACYRNGHQEGFLGGKGGRCVRLTTLPLSYTDCLQILEPQPLGNLQASPGIALVLRSPLLNCEQRLLASSRLSVRPSFLMDQRGSHCTDFHNMSIFRKSVQKFQVSLKSGI
jgi:hypothetical protein